MAKLIINENDKGLSPSNDSSTLVGLCLGIEKICRYLEIYSPLVFKSGFSALHVGA